VILTDQSYFESMGNLKVLIFNYETDPIIPAPVTYTLLFQLANTPDSVNNLIGYFNLRQETNVTLSRLVKVIRTGINLPTGTIDKKNILGSNYVFNTGDTKYIYFQVNGYGYDESSGDKIQGGEQNIRTLPFTTYSDWSFLVSLKIDYIGTTVLKRICFNVLV